MGKSLKRNYILDSSLILESLLDSNKSVIVKQFIVQNTKYLFSSNFLKVEVSNVISKRLRDINLVEAVYETFLDLPIGYLDIDDNILASARTISVQSSTSVYDATYHALAIANDFVLVTLDKKYYDKCKNLGNIELL